MLSVRRVIRHTSVPSCVRLASFLSRKMDAIVVNQFGGPEVLSLVSQYPIPNPASGEVLVKVAAAGVNPADTYVRSGNYAHLPKLPYVPGGDGAGTVVSVGDGVAGYKPGDRVFFGRAKAGSYAQYTVIDEPYVQPLPGNVSFEQGAALMVPYATAYHALFQRGRAVAGETVLIHGATGGVGLAALQFARHRGLTVIGTAGSDQGKKLLEEQGCHHIFDHRSDPDYMRKIATVSPRGVDVVIEMLANVNLDRDLKALAPGGRAVVVGSRGPIEITPRDIMGKRGDILGVMLWTATPAEWQEIYKALQDGLTAGYLNPIVGPRYPLKDAPAAHRDIIESKATTGKMVLLTGA
eukprot:TRINITY_DN6411_c0_g2_i2.p1 TRINITY_DN6411_c0_g2~~TRINITY_DN6411_c0_g2_i2.p1  ORF type:complete len:351 (-),score=97.03 TRINITY_DN6411_c0_g2_i2:866-1918(-)